MEAVPRKDFVYDSLENFTILGQHQAQELIEIKQLEEKFTK
jgi:hypothetical protein